MCTLVFTLPHRVSTALVKYRRSRVFGGDTGGKSGPHSVLWKLWGLRAPRRTRAELGERGALERVNKRKAKGLCDVKLSCMGVAVRRNDRSRSVS